LVKKGRANTGTGKTGGASKASASLPVIITPALLRRWALPQPDEGGDKEERGRVLVVGGERETPGAIVLAAEAALRAGAGKLRVAAPRGIAPIVAAAVPEARVFGLPETGTGVISERAAGKLVELSGGVQCLLVGPGMIDERAAARLMLKVLPRMKGATLILDAAALACLKERGRNSRLTDSRIILTPNADEMAELLGQSVASIKRDPQARARRAAEDFGAVVALKGRETYVTSPGRPETYVNRAGNVGLATSGSGDVLAGLVAGLAARGAEPLQAAVWGVYLHARAGDKLAQRVGPLGYLARELAREVPRLMSELAGPKRR
jgi:ADP-dependent NAD(P)H-hydrate dehydratase